MVFKFIVRAFNGASFGLLVKGEYNYFVSLYSVEYFETRKEAEKAIANCYDAEYVEIVRVRRLK